ncbi:phosphoribosylglycinamide formyltransferase [Salmonella enterica]|nr:phosphoribosylglycinamide formyltransferase [Salmonella enterica subsp. enterica serovar Poona]EEJ7914943.1 phosphoribosylglycinamide formyltransferase [Salmonella enterica]EGI6081582.1 phosphoribosylglycinamide formyltransferase [Salmonella enterica subsp. enterica serovar Urbana]
MFAEKNAGELFDVKSNPQLDKSSFVFTEDNENTYPYFTRTVLNNGIAGYVEYLDEDHKISGNSIAVGMLGMQFFYMERDFYAGQFTKTLFPKFEGMDKKIALYFIVMLNKYQAKLQSILVRNFKQQFDETKLSIPVRGNNIAWDYMVQYIEELEAAHIEELEAAHIEELEAYLLVSGLADSRTRGLADSRTRGLADSRTRGLISHELTPQEYDAVNLLNSNNLVWGAYNLKELFGPTIRGKRLKNADRLPGDLPFVTAGEVNEGVSAFIRNDVVVFPANTTTIDMFGSAKYRNYEYGADDHVAVVHTDKCAKNAAIFITTSIHKSSYTGKFNYGRNFYAKDADELMISLPSKGNKPDYFFMEILNTAVHKLVIKDIVRYADKKLAAYRQVTGSQNDGS